MQRVGMLLGSALMSSLDQIPLDLGTNCGFARAGGEHSSSPWRPWKPEADCEISASCLGAGGRTI